MKIRVLKIVAVKEQKYITSIYANLDPLLSYQQVVGLSGNDFGSLKQASHLECLDSNPLKEISLNDWKYSLQSYAYKKKILFSSSLKYTGCFGFS